MDESKIREIIEKGIVLDSDENSPHHYVNIEDDEESLSVAGFDTREEAESHRTLMIDSLMRLFFRR